MKVGLITAVIAAAELESVDVFSDQYNLTVEEVEKIVTGENCRDAGCLFRSSFVKPPSWMFLPSQVEKESQTGFSWQDVVETGSGMNGSAAEGSGGLKLWEHSEREGQVDNRPPTFSLQLLLEGRERTRAALGSSDLVTNHMWRNICRGH